MSNIKTIAVREKLVSNVIQDQFTVSVTGWRGQIIDRLIKWGWLRNATKTVAEITTVRIDKNDFVSQLFACHDEAMRHITPDTLCKIIMGPRDFAKLNRSSEVKSLMTDFNIQCKWGHPDGRTELIGLEVQIVPWIEGIAVVPK